MSNSPTPHCARRVQIGTAAYDTFAARPSKWGNPYVIGIHGTRGEVIAMYERWLRGRPELMAALPELKGKVLACYCEPTQRCHVDVILRVMREEGIET